MGARMSNTQQVRQQHHQQQFTRAAPATVGTTPSVARQQNATRYQQMTPGTPSYSPAPQVPTQPLQTPPVPQPQYQQPHSQSQQQQAQPRLPAQTGVQMPARNVQTQPRTVMQAPAFSANGISGAYQAPAPSVASRPAPPMRSGITGAYQVARHR